MLKKRKKERPIKKQMVPQFMKKNLKRRNKKANGTAVHDKEFETSDLIFFKYSAYHYDT